MDRQEKLIYGYDESDISYIKRRDAPSCRPSYALLADPVFSGRGANRRRRRAPFSAACAPARACVRVPSMTMLRATHGVRRIGIERERGGGGLASRPTSSDTISGTCRMMTRVPLRAYTAALRAHGQQVVVRVRSLGSHINRHGRDHPWTDRARPRRSATRRWLPCVSGKLHPTVQSALSRFCVSLRDIYTRDSSRVRSRRPPTAAFHPRSFHRRDPFPVTFHRGDAACLFTCVSTCWDSFLGGLAENRWDLDARYDKALNNVPFAEGGGGEGLSSTRFPKNVEGHPRA